MKNEILACSVKNDQPLMNPYLKIFCSKRSIVFYGGINNGVVSDIIFKFDRDKNIISELPELPEQNKDICVYSIGNTLYAISNRKKYRLDNNTWKHEGHTGIKNPYAIQKNGTTYIISKGAIFLVSPRNTFTILIESEYIDTDRLVYSSKKDRIYFTSHYYDITDNSINFNNTQYSTDILLHNDDSVVIDDRYINVLSEDGYIFLLDYKKKEIKYKLFYENHTHTNNMSFIKEIVNFKNIIHFQNNHLYITEESGDTHKISTINTETLEYKQILSKEIKNKSFSQRPLYNHTTVKGLLVDGNPLLIGSNGFYNDTSEFDNSFYYKHNTTKFSVNSESISVFNLNNNIGIVCSTDDITVIYEIDSGGNIINKIYIPGNKEEYNVIQARYSLVFWKYPNNLYVHDKKPKSSEYSPDNKTILGLCVDNYYSYYVAKDNNDIIELHKISLYTDTLSVYKLNISIDNLIDVKIFDDRLYIMYTYKDNNFLNRVLMN